MALWPSGKAKVCNTSTPGSNPGGASESWLKSQDFFLFIKSICVGKRTEKGIDESEKDGILIEVKYGAMAKW